ncbi:Oidioi.mRNA.OKI2018_I69.YSR.g17187.t1.cds [Oikopleura dioica]|uniref:Oidioi.mRNA.OKI2018_I69.YSR.g17187.t1.cds n=1 Tax=Oikopleura dioica TaxID=34765 RepID=A0ABN7SIX0_OIKDI|nr:Oidioi.mRNA.OKI2018_I69.YSR.g17187.t1.cds [Oikopleura dioica]
MKVGLFLIRIVACQFTYERLKKKCRRNPGDWICQKYFPPEPVQPPVVEPVEPSTRRVSPVLFVVLLCLFVLSCCYKCYKRGALNAFNECCKCCKCEIEDDREIPLEEQGGQQQEEPPQQEEPQQQQQAPQQTQQEEQQAETDPLINTSNMEVEHPLAIPPVPKPVRTDERAPLLPNYWNTQSLQQQQNVNNLTVFNSLTNLSPTSAAYVKNALENRQQEKLMLSN